MITSGPFHGKVVAITGGTSGIGQALVAAFLEAGAKVATCARSADSVAAFAKANPDLLCIAADVTETAGRQRFLDFIDVQFGRLDILISNAGRLVERDFAGDSLADDALAEEFALNLVAPVQLTAAALARFPMLEAIVLVSSGYALVTPTRSPTYGAAKAGLHGFAEGLRRQLQLRNVHVLEVLPPAVDTPAIAHRDVPKVSPEAVADATIAALKARRPTAMIGAVRWLPWLLRLAPGILADRIAQT
ncbi:SDR family NAD(P)-dependent oxidoreductase [Novosphingobium sp.]|uniref:SDR family NAD(P)-dependent oxidoreductase n=1 Tax=Novosphingobium sp. TaxID=1874826 RepID=UPI0027328B10|nr:SDR family NAD(P)-dependent oxidoreductase [Novosphingobium sp.]MDP3907553.1 SDR family NAD(P)-dependent oxidoreductase [Novosphingobium sp.]